MKAAILDGAMGTELRRRGAVLEPFSERVNLTRPELVQAIHRDYLDAGSEILYACTFGANPIKVKDQAIEPVIKAALQNARIAAAGKARTALDMGTLGELLEPYGDLPEETAAEAFRRILRAGQDADLIVLETLFDLREALLALESAKALYPEKPCFVTMTFQLSGKTLTGCTPAEAARELSAAGADAVGLNCSLGPAEALPLLRQMREHTALPLIAKPNAGLPDAEGRYAMSPEQFADAMLPLFDAGAQYLGGCCGTDPAYIRALAERLA